MQDEDFTLLNFCTDLVTLTKNEAFPKELLGSIPSGSWIDVRRFCLRIGLQPPEAEAQLFAAWLPDPKANDAYAVILFYDDESKWCMAAHYNRARIVCDGHVNLAPEPTGAAVAPSAASAIVQGTQTSDARG
jgi:hypothetical protein